MSVITKKLQLKADDTDTDSDERLLTVIATDSSEDRDMEQFDTASLLLPLRDGSTIEVGKLTGDEQLDVTAFINHERDVRNIIGSVTSASVNDSGQLEMVIRLADTPDADTVYTLAKGGHLGNNISVTYDMSDVEEIAGVYHGATVLEVSVVWRGSNKHARVLSVKADKGEYMFTDKKTPEEVDAALEAAKTALATAEEAVDAALAANEVADDEDNNGDTPGGQDDEAKDAETGDNDKEENMGKDVVTKAMTAITKATTAPKAVVKSADSNSYLKSKQATKDWFANLGAHRNDSAAAAKAWSANLADKGIAGDSFLPSSIEQIFFDNFEESADVLNVVSRVNGVKQMYVNALTGTGDAARAAGHTKGDTKRDQKLINKRRNVLCRMIYKKLALDQIDLWTAPELMEARLGELAKQLVNEIQRAIVIGDGRTAPASGAADYRVFVDDTGIRSIKSDVTGSTTANSFSSLVASIYTPAADDANIYDKVLSAKAQLKGDGKVALIAKKSAVTELYRAKNTSGGYLIQPSASLEATLAVDKVIQPSWMDEDSDYDAYLLTFDAYKLIGDANPTQRAWFDGNLNQDNLLLEQPLGGSLSGYKTAVGIKVATK